MIVQSLMVVIRAALPLVLLGRTSTATLRISPGSIGLPMRPLGVDRTCQTSSYSGNARLWVPQAIAQFWQDVMSRVPVMRMPHTLCWRSAGPRMAS